MGQRIDAITSFMLIVVASVTSGSYLYRTFTPSAQQRAGAPAAAVRLKNWPTVASMGHTIHGDRNAHTTMVVLGDLQCPACRGFHLQTVRQAIAKYPNELRIQYVHFPLAYHRFALSAARATECASARGDAGRWIDLIYDKQDSLGLKSWDSFAAEAGISDTTGIDACGAANVEVKAISDGIKLGRDLKVRGTPTVIIDGWIYPATPSMEQIDSVVRRARSVAKRT